MSPESPVELHQRSLEAFNRRDFDAMLALADPGLEFVPFNLEVEGATAYHGHEGLLSFVDEYMRIFRDFRVEIDEIRDLGETTLAHARLTGYGRGSDIAFEQAVWQAVRWQDGKALWWRSYRTEAEALEAIEAAP